MPNLFDFDTGREGYRLESFEFYNWGGFDNRIWSVKPGGDSSLLTGGNGSGKTTLVDALVTLLVPPTLRHYNQSSGAERKKERTELSYVLGAVGSLREEDQASARVEYLRKRNIYSVLVGTFRNEALDKTLALGQIRWFTPAGAMSKLYFTCNKEIRIREDIHPLDNGGKYRKRLEKDFPIRFFDSFQQYSLYFIKAFGFRSEKALSLFSQTVGVKVLGNLNEFIRSHMLEKPGSEEAFSSLYDNYQTLLGAHKQIEKSEKQLALLRPIIKSAEEFRNCGRAVEDKEDLKRRSPGIFMGFKKSILERDSLLLADKKEGVVRELDRQREDQRGREERLFTVRQELEGNKTAVRLSVLESEIEHSRQALERCRKDFQDYDQLSGAAGFGAVKSLADFQKNRHLGGDKLGEAQSEHAARQDDIYSCKRDRELLCDEQSILDKEIGSLNKRKSNIPFRSIELRRRLCTDLGLEEETLPFAGELLRVRKEEALWLEAAERVLHGFALCLLVPDEHYRQVNAYVNSRNLKGRLIYYRVKTGGSGNFSWDSDGKDHALLTSKLEIKENSPFESWLRDTLDRRFTYSCVEEVKDLARYDSAVTPQGLIKSRNRHEKDDRPERRGEANHVLGWNNREKLKALISQREEIARRLGLLEAEAGKLDGLQKSLDNSILLLNRLLEFRDFERIDWFRHEELLARMEKEKRELLADSEDLKRLESLKRELEEAISGLGEKIQFLQMRLGRLEQDEENLTLRAEELEQDASRSQEEDGDPEDLKSYLPSEPAGLSWEEITRLQTGVREKIEEEIRSLLEKKSELTGVLVRRMQEFITPGAAVLEEFPGWTGETVDLEASENNIPAFEAFNERLKKDDLPRFRKKFREFLNERMLEDLIGFRESLDREERNILKSIDELNRSLKKILYNREPASYISLLGETSRDVAVREFKTALKHSMGDAGKIALGDEAELENTFHKMQSLIRRLKEEENYRKKVLDVRNWLEFSAVERYREDDSQKQFYQDSHSLSGGEKAKLAYTILASAIAYQFGINEEGDKSFRFVMVDEAFSKVDPENSAYAMDLFKSLSLQLMVVTPLDKINLVENYIRSVHYVERKEQTACLHNLSFQEYEELKKEQSL